jgi:hypothetical protein
LFSSGPATAQANRAGLVVQFADGSVREFCVNLGGPERTGEELLRLSGLDVAVEVKAIGSWVCRIGRTGCDFPAENCQCQCENMADCVTWSYNVLQGGGWRYSDLGPSARAVRNGDVDGWAWGASSVQQGAEPPLRSFEQLCAVQAQPSPSPSAAPTLTPRPTGTGRPSATAWPTSTAPLPPSPLPGTTARPSPTRLIGPAMTVAPAAPRTGGAGTPTATSAGYPGPFGSTATALWQAGATEFAALTTSMPAEPQRMSASTIAAFATRYAVASAEAAATASPTLAPIAVLDRADNGRASSATTSSTGASFGGYLAFLVVALTLGGAWWWLRRGQTG